MDVHAGFMARAIALAQEAAVHGEIPVGALVVSEDGRILGTGHNRSIGDCDPTAHAEIVALREASRTLGNYRLENCVLYVTLEPCPMCLGAIFHSRIRAVYFGASDPKSGACGSVVALHKQPALNPHCSVHGGVLEQRCAQDLREYFIALRVRKKKEHARLREDALRIPDAQLLRRLPGVESRYFGDLAASRGLRVHVWGRNVSIKASALVLCIPSFGHWAWQFRDLLSLEVPSDTTLLCVDLPGYGLSDRSKAGWEFDPKLQVSVLKSIVGEVLPKELTLVGHGSGGFLAMGLAREICSDFAVKVVLVDPVDSHVAAIADAQGKLPRSTVQLCKSLMRSSLQADCDGALAAPYPDDGFSRGLLRWAADDCQSEALRADVGAMVEEGSSLPPIMVFEQAGEMRTHVEVFLQRRKMEASNIGDWSSFSSRFWNDLQRYSGNMTASFQQKR